MPPPNIIAPDYDDVGTAEQRDAVAVAVASSAGPAAEGAAAWASAAVSAVYAPLRRGLAHHIAACVTAVVAQLMTAASAGEWCEAAAQCLWVVGLLDAGSPLHALLSEFVLVFFLLCTFHVNAALEKQAKIVARVPRHLVGAVYEGAVAVIAGRLSAAEYKVQIASLLDGVTDSRGAPYLRADGSSAWWDYFSSEWLTRDSFVLASLAFRAHLSHFLLHTNNKCEAELFSVLGHALTSLVANMSEGEAMRAISGSPLPDEASARGQSRSITGRSLLTLWHMLRGFAKIRGGWRREAVLHAASRLADRAAFEAEAAAAAGADDAAAPVCFSAGVGSRDLGAIDIGGTAAGLAPSAPMPIGSPPAMANMGTAQAHALGYRTAEARRAALLDDDGRMRDGGHTVSFFLAAMRRVTRELLPLPPSVAAAVRPVDAQSDLAGTPAGRLALLAAPGAATADFRLLQVRGTAHLLYVAKLLAFAVPPDLLAVLDDVLCKGGKALAVWSDDAARLATSQRVLEAIRDKAHPLPRRDDFFVPPPGTSVGARAAPPTAPHVDIVYFVQPEVSATAVSRECVRIFDGGCRLSLRTRKPLDFNYLIPLFDQLGMAAELDRTGRGASPVPAGYVGRQCVADTTEVGSRPRQHFGPGGCPALSEVAHRRTQREEGGGYVHTPLVQPSEPPLVVRRRILAIVPHGKPAVADLLESVLMFLLARAGVSLYNATPGPGPSSGGARYLEDIGEERAQLDVDVESLVAVSGSRTMALRAAGDSVQALFLRRALLTGARLVQAGAFFRNGAPVVVPGAVSQLDAADVLLARSGRPVVRVQLALDACSCGAQQLLCAHLLWARMWFEAQTGVAFPVTSADWLLFAPPSAGRSQAGRSVQARATRPAAGPPLRPVEAAAAAAMSTASALVLLRYASEADMVALAQSAQRLASDALASAQRARFGRGLSHAGAPHMRGGLRTAAQITEEQERRRTLIAVPPDRRGHARLHLALRTRAHPGQRHGRATGPAGGGLHPHPRAGGARPHGGVHGRAAALRARAGTGAGAHD